MSPNGRAAEVAPRTLLGRLRAAVRARHYSPRTEESYVGWVKRFVVFHGRQHPDQLGEAEVRAFLEHLAERVGVSASTQNQAVAALLFLYESVLGRRLAVSPHGIVHAKELQRWPVVLSREEARAVLAQLRGVARLVALLLYGSGLRLLECLSLRVKDVDFHRGEIRVRGGKGGVDRVAPLPMRVQGPLADHLARWRARHARDVERGGGRVALPGAFERKVAASATEWAWQWVFPAMRTHRDPDSGEERRHHRVGHSACRAGRGAPGRDCKTGNLSHVSPLVRHPSARRGVRHQDGTGVAGASRCAHHDDLHTRTEPRGAGCTESGGHSVAT